MRKSVFPLTILLLAALAMAAGAAVAAANEKTEAAIAAVLVDKLGDDAKTIKVAFYDGKAVLSGQVAEDCTGELAKEVALYVAGVQKVENKVEAQAERKLGKGKILSESDDSALETDVKSALHKEIGTYFQDVEVEACLGIVSVRGTVPDKARHEIAMAAAQKVKGVEKVIDLIRVAD